MISAISVWMLKVDTDNDIISKEIARKEDSLLFKEPDAIISMEAF